MFKGCKDGVHKFEARYDMIPPEIASLKGSASAVAEFVKAASRREYVRDVCIRCGQTIERTKP